MIHVKQYKKCGSCRCYYPASKKCSIGYQTEYIKFGDIVVDCRPLEPCPKPLTVLDSIEAIKLYNKQ